MQDALMSPESRQDSPILDEPSSQQSSSKNEADDEPTGRPPSVPDRMSHSKSVDPANLSNFSDTFDDEGKRPIPRPVTDRPAKQREAEVLPIHQDPQPPSAQQPARNVAKPTARISLPTESHCECSVLRVHHQGLTTVILPANATRQPFSKDKRIHQSIGNHVIGSAIHGKKLPIIHQAYLLTRHRHRLSALS